MKISMAALLVAFALLLSSARAETKSARPIAMVTGVVGVVSIVSGHDTSPASIGQALFDGQTIKLGPGAQVTLLYGNGQIVEYKGLEQSTVAITQDSTRGGGSQRLAGKGQAAGGAIFETRSRGVNSGDMVYDDLRGNGDGTPIAPRDERVRADNPTFSWRGEAAAEYHLIVTPVGGKPLVDVTVKGTSYRYKGKLPAGVKLHWSAAQAGAEPERATFHTLSDADAAALKDAQATIEQAFSSSADATTRALLLGLLFKKYQLYDDAIASFQTVLAREPKNAYVHEELAWLYYQIGDLAQSKSHFDVARP